MENDIHAEWRSDSREDFFHTLLDSLKGPLVFCDMNDTIRYMNRAAIAHYDKRGGDKLIGRSVLDCHNPVSRDMIAEIKARFLSESDLDEVLITDNERHRIWMRAVRENRRIIGYYERYEPPKGS